MRLNTKFVMWLIGSSLGLLVLSFLIISFFSKSISFALNQLLYLKLYLIPLALGFGLQVALFRNIKNKITQSGALVGSTGAASTGAMIACCAHHIAEALPFLAIGGLSVFFTSYQKELLILSIFLNWLGVLYMVKKLRVLDAK